MHNDSTACNYRSGLQQKGEYMKVCYKEFDLISFDLFGFCMQREYKVVINI